MAIKLQLIERAVIQAAK